MNSFGNIKDIDFDYYKMDFFIVNEEATKSNISKLIVTKNINFTLLRVIKSDLEKITLWLCDFRFIDLKVILVVCRGTKGIKAWMENADIFPLNQKIMDGFFDGYLSIQKQIYMWLEFYIKQTNINQIGYTGYSRGGATSQIIHFYANKKLSVKSETTFTITYASPRVFQNSEETKNSEADVCSIDYDNLDKKEGSVTLHYVQVNDPVSNVPPVFLGYQRTGRTVKIGKPNKFLSKIPILRMVLYHPMSKYKKDLKKLEY